MATHKPINILEAFAAAPPPLDYVLPNMVAGTVGALVSPGGAGKSMLALQLAAQIAGRPAGAARYWSITSAGSPTCRA